LGDRAENRAVRGLFLGEERKTRLKVSSTKGSIGHLLGGAGSVEAIFAVLAVKTGDVPRNVNLVEFDGDDDGGEKGEWDDRIDYVPFRPCWEGEKGGRDKGDVKVALSNSFGFGGTNASLCFRRWEG
jgi:3-oxoacyl-[acyl-carrier-protein] synthase II